MAATYTNGLYNGTSVACQYASPLLGSRNYRELPQLFRSAVANTILEHPLCQVGIIEADEKKPSWVPLQTLDIAKLIEWHVVYCEEEYNYGRQAILKRQLDTKFSSVESQPGWRVAVIHQSQSKTLEVFFVFNHVNFDGQAGKIFHEGLLRHLNILSSSGAPLPGGAYGPCIVPTNATESNIPPPVEAMAEFPLSPLYTISTLWRKYAPQCLRRKTPIPPGHAWPRIINPTLVRTCVKTVIVPRSTVDGALAACRARNNITMTALLHTLTMISLARHLPESLMTGMQSVTTIDLRRHMSNPLPVPSGHADLDPRRTMANIVGRLTHRFDHSMISMVRRYPRNSSTTEKQQTLPPAFEEIMWSVAAKVRSEIQERLDMGLRDNELGMMKFADDFRGFVKATLNRPRVATFLVSNLVLIDGEPGDVPTAWTTSTVDDGATSGTTVEPEGSKWTIKRAAFTLSAHVNGAGIHLGVMTVKGGDMVIDLSWQKGVVDDEVCEELGEDLKAWLGHIGM